MQVNRLPEQNSVTLTGRLTRDAELRFTPKGQPVCSFGVAVNRRYLAAGTNEWKDDVSFIPVVVWGQSAERCGERGKKGVPVHVAGRLKSRSWETKDGQKRSAIDVVANRVQFLSKTEAGSSDAAVSADETAGQPVENTEEVPF